MIGQGTRAELLWIVAGQSLVLLLGMLTLKLLTYLLGPEEYGRFALGLTIAGTLNLFVYGPLGHAVARYFHICANRGSLAELEYLSKRLLQGIALGVLMIGIAVTFWNGSDHVWGVLILSALGYGVASGTLSVWLAELNTRRERRSYSILQSADALLRLVGSVVLVMLVGILGSAAMSGFLLGALASLLLTWWLGRRQTTTPGEFGKLFGKDALGRDFGAYAGSISLFAVPAIFSNYGDRWIIQQMLSDAHVGIYVALAQIANAPANLILAIFSQTINPILFQLAGDATDSESIRVSRQMLYRAMLQLIGLLALMTIVSYALGEWIVITLTSSEFVPYASLLWVLVLSAAIFQIGQALAAEAFLYNRPFQLFFPKMLHAMVFLGISLWLVHSRKLEGVAIAAVIASAIYLPLVLLSNTRAAKARVMTGVDNSPEIIR
ncbi:MAG: oligosaccharide flippase family protein [Betaproteobacteria bacterium]|nr:oligosaccharide flippase family protein [Betaproteobacteria bacterium]